MIPLCREHQYQQIYEAISSGVSIIVVSGPMSSGKTTTIDSICSKDNLPFKTSHVFCDCGMEISDIYSQIAKSMGSSEKKPRSIRALVESIESSDHTAVFLDSFDLLDNIANDLYISLYSAIESGVMNNITLVFVSRSHPSHFVSDPISSFNIDFPAYSRSQIEKVVLSYHNNKEDTILQAKIRRVIDICEPITKDIRDIIFVSHKMSKSKLNPGDTEFGTQIIMELKQMRTQKECRVIGLSKTARIILLSIAIASKTSSVSDLMRFSRSIKRNRNHTKLLEEHEFVNLERVFAISKAIIFHHFDSFEIDISAYLALQKLVALGLIDIRGDIKVDAKIKCLASEIEIHSVSKTLGVDFTAYTLEA